MWLAADRMLLFESGHYQDLKEALSAGLPVLFAAIGVSALLAALAAIPPSALPVAVLSELVAPRRRQLALVAVAICLSAAIVLAVVFWVL
jgi:hypothetical protein